MNNLADLNFFMKAIEKDLIKNMKSDNPNSYPITPSTLKRRVEDQIRALGAESKHSDHNRRSQEKLSQLKLLTLNTMGKIDDNSTPNNHSNERLKGSPQKLMI